MTCKFELDIGPDTAESAIESNSTLDLKEISYKYRIFCFLRVKYYLQGVRTAIMVHGRVGDATDELTLTLAGPCIIIQFK